MAQQLSQGIVIPVQTDNISAAGVDEMRLLGTTADTALAGMKNDVDDLATVAIERYRGILPDGADLDSYKDRSQNGIWALSASATYSNTPARGFVVIENGGLGSRQTIISSGTGETLTRMRSGTGSSAGWRPWQSQTGLAGSEVPSGTSFDDLREPGVYVVKNNATAASVSGWPEGVTPSSATLTVSATAAGIAFQTLRVYGDVTWERRTASVNSTPFPWTSWTKTSASGGTCDGADSNRNTLLIQDFSRRHGGVWKTGGLGAVALRFDHGLASFQEHVLPHTSAAGIVVSQALNSRNWGYAENEGVTAETVNSWVEAGHVEIWNHSATHLNPTTSEKIRDEIVNGLAELRAQIPAAQIDGWAVPGVGQNDPYQGFHNGQAATDYSDSQAGRLILANHAVSTGYITGTEQRILDGEVRQGQFHYTMDVRTVEQIKTQIDTAVADKTGLQLMLHPSVIGSDGSITAADIAEVVAYLVTRRDAGDLVVCSPYELMLADSRA